MNLAAHVAHTLWEARSTFKHQATRTKSCPVSPSTRLVQFACQPCKDPYGVLHHSALGMRNRQPRQPRQPKRHGIVIDMVLVAPCTQRCGIGETYYY